MSKKAIFIAATGQNVGKTTICLGAIAGCQRYFSKVGFMKPVGQQHIRTEDGRRVDKDVVLFKEHFHLPHAYQHMSPVIFPQGFTRQYLDGEIHRSDLITNIQEGFHHISTTSDFIIVEGTGHVGVGSIVELCNAYVARQLDLSLILISKGGLGSSFDELAINRALCEQYGVKIAGVILNRVLEDKRDMVIEYMQKALKRWNIPLIGAIPYDPFLSIPSMQDFESLFKTTLLSGEQFHYCHFHHMRLAAGSVETFLALTEPNQLIVTPASREDLILALIRFKEQQHTLQPAYGFILTSQHAPSRSLIEHLRQAQIPALYVPLPTFEAMVMINSFTAKIRKEDTQKVEQAIHLVTRYLDFQALMQAPD
ncbi:MAG: AAA family ATPase [Verrucomicrobia bacterium]|nr:AAA family ATPase [Verrucomicrobiota bacterium]MBS0646060.1 AAA family ATPase [Verrucomicrobiota bacterium]